MTPEDLTVGYTIHGNTTVVTVQGQLDSEACRLLADSLEAAQSVRGRGPIVVDLSGAGRLAPAAMVYVAQAARDAAHAGRDLTVRF
ncbi:anti-anti-sigma factor [Phytohabitans houttuyneae]|uniref:STAS domain-containing protein n=1 Tax=Phytohabitans houttuyneae TaxID=1076126 RepID=A0A6V8KFV1_9ACTN|nr:anti-anti-sigma factor [Phytohabitans houttuyneae]GFJ80949.1 hypothetical protein Phou_051290 [Phytohabitans houttuyneae]